MKKYSADFVFDGYKLHRNSTIIFDNDKVVELRNDELLEGAVHYSGMLMPGFINTHCHLELSHLQGKVATGTGLLPFLKSVVSMRDVDQNLVDQRIKEEDAYMWNQGIQAVGDISNKADTFPVKSASSIRYYTFVEMFDLLQDSFTENTFKQYKEVYEQFDTENGNNKSAVPHAPYTVTTGLFSLINSLNSKGKTISIHNQETVHENQYFQDKSGGFSEFFNSLGIKDDTFSAIGKDSIDYAMKHMDSKQKTLFVHNTTSTRVNIRAALAWNPLSYWATCANANLYIENSLPNYAVFIDEGAKLTIGTDSLSSNWQLSILEELKTIQRYNSYIPVELLLQWSTINGAEALSMDKEIGSFDIGKAPGLLQIDGFEGENLQNCTVSRLF